MEQIGRLGRELFDASLRESSVTAISVVIACHNGEETLGAALEGLVVQEWDRPWEIILSDNGSTDGSAAIFLDFAKRHPDLTMRIVDSSQRPGQPQALNMGVEAAQGRAVLFLDADDVPAPGWLRAMGEALDEDDIVAARLEVAKLNPGWMQAYRDNLQVRELERLPFPPYCHHAAGATLGFRKTAFHAIGAFDHDYPALHDTDFCIRAHLQGFRMKYVPGAELHYRFRSDLGAIYRQSYSYAKYAVLLAKRYRDRGEAPKGRWTRFVRSWSKLSRWYLTTAVRGKPASMVDQARFQRTLGREAGRLAGVLEYRAPPP